MSMDILLPKKTYLSDNTKFKIVAYWNYKPNGQFWSIVEKNMKQHRKYIDSFDYVASAEGRTITRHDEAFYKLLVYAEKYVSRAEKILIYMNDLSQSKQFLLAKLVNDKDLCQLIIPVFKKDELGIGHVYVDRLPAPPLEESTLIQRELTKKPKSILEV